MALFCVGGADKSIPNQKPTCRQAREKRYFEEFYHYNPIQNGMMQNWNKDIQNFVSMANKHQVRMLMVGGGAVNFHGYQRHSADVDFWIDTSKENLEKLVSVFKEMGYDFNDFPEAVKNQEQNISVKFSPAGLDLELITRFAVNKSFEEAFEEAEEAHLQSGNLVLKWRVLSLDDLITSKLKSGRPKDLLDINELKKVNPFKE